MGPFAVVFHKVLAQAQEQLAHDGVAVQINILMLDAAPKSFHKDVVIRAAPPVHTDRDLLSLEHPGKGLAGELDPLVAVEHFWFTLNTQCVFKAIHTEQSLHAIADGPVQYPPRVPIHDRHQTH